jgi:hypothetical protein
VVVLVLAVAVFVLSFRLRSDAGNPAIKIDVGRRCQVPEAVATGAVGRGAERGATPLR